MKGRRPVLRKIRYKLRKAEGKRLILLMLALLVVFTAAFSFFNMRLRPVIVEMVDMEVNDAALIYIGEAVEQELALGLTYGDIVTLEKTADGTVTAIVTDMAEINRLQYGIAKRVVESSEHDREITVEVPLGTIFGINLASARGPKIPIKAIISNDADVVLKSDFSTAGINQTHHRIIAEIRVSYKFFVPGRWQASEVITDVVVAETVIMGTVPESYTYLGSSDKVPEEYAIIK